MTLQIATDRVPLSLDENGTARVGGSRVPLDTVVFAFRHGATAEQIAEQYPSLRLSDIYSVIGYYLNHQDEIDKYLSVRTAQASEVRAEIEARNSDLGSIRERLTRRSKLGK